MRSKNPTFATPRKFFKKFNSGKSSVLFRLQNFLKSSVQFKSENFFKKFSSGPKNFEKIQFSSAKVQFEFSSGPKFFGKVQFRSEKKSSVQLQNFLEKFSSVEVLKKKFGSFQFRYQNSHP